MIAVTVSLAMVKYFFPEFEFSWLGEEIKQNLPLEMNFIHEAANARRAIRDFENVKGTTLYIPEVLRATKRTLVMEFIEGARVTEISFTSGCML